MHHQGERLAGLRVPDELAGGRDLVLEIQAALHGIEIGGEQGLPQVIVVGEQGLQLVVGARVYLFGLVAGSRRRGVM